MPVNGKNPLKGADHSSLSSSQSVGDPLRTCPGPTGHWIKVKLLREGDENPRPQYWPKNNPLPYANEHFKASIGGFGDNSLTSQGYSSIENVPAGTCTFKFDKFYADIDVYFEKQLKE